MIWLAFPAMVVLAVRLLIVLVNIVTRQWLKESGLSDQPLVSVLIPARNEEGNLPLILQDLLDHDYENLEILVYDDVSEDRTAEVIESFTDRDKRIRYLAGEPLPEGWLGKNHACYQLARHAQGDYLLFLDADVRVYAGLIRRSLAHLQKHDLSLLSIFPRQLMETFGERLTVPAMNWILVSLLPLRLIRLTHYPSLAAANGQFMLFRARVYRQHQFHRYVRTHHVEDIRIIRTMKAMGYRTHTLLSSGEVACRMYRGFGEAVAGFTRSMFAFFGGSGLVLFLFMLFTTFGVVFVGLSLGWIAAAIYLAIAGLLRTLVALMGRQPVWMSIVLAPLQQAAFVIMVTEAFRRRAQKQNTWKGRAIRFE